MTPEEATNLSSAIVELAFAIGIGLIIIGLAVMVLVRVWQHHRDWWLEIFQDHK